MDASRRAVVQVVANGSKVSFARITSLGATRSIQQNGL